MKYLAAELSRYQKGIFFQSLQSSGVLNFVQLTNFKFYMKNLKFEFHE